MNIVNGTRGENFDENEGNLVNSIINNLFMVQASDWGKKFNRFQIATPYFAVPNTREYLFFTKPDLHIMKTNQEAEFNTLNVELQDRWFWQEMKKRYRRVISDLQASSVRPSQVDRDKHVFIPMLTNAVNSTLDLPSSTAETTETSSTIYGTNIQYRKGSQKSDEGYDFSLDFIDLPGLDVYYFFKMWDEYENLKELGLVSPPTYTELKYRIHSYNRDRGKEGKNIKDTPNNTGLYRSNKILHDQIAIYKFVVNGSDAETIIHYSKLIGCFPKSVPRDAFSSFKGDGLITYSVDWHAQFVEDMNPEILLEFSALCNAYFKSRGLSIASVIGTKNNNNLAKLKREDIDMIDTSFVTHPIIVQEKITDKDKSIKDDKNTFSNGHFTNLFPEAEDKPGNFVYKLKWANLPEEKS